MSTHADWLSLVELDGLVVSEPVLEEHFPDGPVAVPRGTHHWFRRQAERFRVAEQSPEPAKRTAGARQWIDYLLEEVCELPRDAWRKAGELPPELSVHLGEIDQELRPDRALVHGDKPVLLVSLVHPDQGLQTRDREPGRWRASPLTKLERLLRETKVPLGLCTNGDDIRLLYARPGITTGQIGWTTRLLVEEKATLDAFQTLLGRDLLLPKDPAAHCLADLCRLSQDRQGEVADQLGEQVRNGLERLIWAWDEADRAVDGRLLAAMSEGEIYEMGLCIMMRLVFLLYAEERHLLPHGEVLYDQGYGLTYLWHALLNQKRDDEARLDLTFDAWDRFLATCRLVHGGCSHPDLSLLAYGGRLFDPKRFPALESPNCRVPNRTMYEVLRLLLFARQKKGGEPQRVGYWAIDVEQIGYIYEGLLDHRCARAGDEPMVKLRGAGEASLPLTELEALAKKPAALVDFVVERTGRKPDGIREALEAEPERVALDKLARFPEAVALRVRPFANVVQCEEIVPPRWRFLTTGASRRASGAHYTPQSLTERIVRVTLEPLAYRNVDGKPGLLVEPREVKSARELLDLKLCDMAMGSGAFLVQAVRYLGDRVVEAWDRALAKAHEASPTGAPVLSMPYAESPTDPEAERPIDPEHRDEMVLWARRYVVERSIYGVDVNPLAVEMGKLSLWLTTLAKDRPFTFLDHALRCGDSLVGVDEEQLRTWSLDRRGSGSPLLEKLIGKAVDEALERRRELRHIVVLDAADIERKRALLEAADRALVEARLAGNLLVAPSFTPGKAAEQTELRRRLLDRFVSEREEHRRVVLRTDAKRLLGSQRTFHWPFEFPEVFLEGDRAGFHAFVGNPPFVGGQFIRRQLGEHMLGYLRERWPESHGTADLVAFFFLRAFGQLRAPGTLGLIATNTISQGDTRESGLDRILAEGGHIYAAVPRMPWPGQAAVNVSVIHLVKGTWYGLASLDGTAVATISTSLDAGGHEARPERLALNKGRSFQGSTLVGLGFTMDPCEAKALINKNKRNAEVLFPYLNGKDLNTSPDQFPTRWAINFLDWELERASQYSDCMCIVRDKVYPERKANNRANYRDFWWRYAEARPGLYRTIAPLERVLVVARVSRTGAFVFVPNRWVFNEQTVVFATAETARFTILQSGIHEQWARKYSSSMRTDLRYAPSDCFETFPFPPLPERDLDRALGKIGERYHEHRRALMLENNEGLTKTYNRFHDPEDNSDGIAKLRALHVEMDLAVRDAYGWTDLDLEHGWQKTVTSEEKKDKKTGKVRLAHHVEHRFTISEAAKQEVLRRLLALNHELYAKEVAAGLHDKKKGKRADDEGVDDAEGDGIELAADAGAGADDAGGEVPAKAVKAAKAAKGKGKKGRGAKGGGAAGGGSVQGTLFG